MYVPEKFRVDDIDVLHNTMRQIGAAAVVGQGPDGIVATRVPIEAKTVDDPDWLKAHLATLTDHFESPMPCPGNWKTRRRVHRRNVPRHRRHRGRDH